MTKRAARQKVDEILKEQFKYIYKRHTIDINTFQLIFQMDSRTHELRMNFCFQESWCDVVCFISPTSLTPGTNEYWEALQCVNYVNWNVKSWGRFYIDLYGDLAYSLRLDYSVLESMPREARTELETAVDYYADLFVPFLKVCQGKESFVQARKFIDEIYSFYFQ